MPRKTKKVEEKYRENNRVYTLDGHVDAELTKIVDEKLYEPIEKVTIILKKVDKNEQKQ